MKKLLITLAATCFAGVSIAGELSIYEDGKIGVGHQEILIGIDEYNNYLKTKYKTDWDVVGVYVKNDIRTILWRCNVTGETKETLGLPPDVKLNVSTGDYVLQKDRGATQ